MSQQNRYHIHFKGRRTTITVDSIISELLAVKLGMLPDAPEAGFVCIKVPKVPQEMINTPSA